MAWGGAALLVVVGALWQAPCALVEAPVRVVGAAPKRDELRAAYGVSAPRAWNLPPLLQGQWVDPAPKEASPRKQRSWQPPLRPAWTIAGSIGKLLGRRLQGAGTSGTRSARIGCVVPGSQDDTLVAKRQVGPQGCRPRLA